MNLIPRPMLAKPFSHKLVRFPCYVQEKLDGVRAIHCNGKFYSRTRNTWLPEMTRHIEPTNLYILDGEFYHPNRSLQEINGAMSINRLEPTEITKEIKFYIFDMINLDKQYLRTARLESLGDMPGCKIVPSKLVQNQGEADDYYRSILAKGGEGIVYRRLDGLYVGDRTDLLLKQKKTTTKEFVCVGVTPGKGKYSDTLGALKLDNGDGQTFKASGMTDAERDKFWANPPIGKQITVRYDNTSDNGTPVRARYVTIRDYE